MPHQVRIISGPRDSSYDHHVRRLISERGYGAERHYFGIATPERAREVRSKLATAGRHLGVSVKAFWLECGGCQAGGADCRYHVSFTCYDPAAARQYKARQAGNAAQE